MDSFFASLGGNISAWEWLAAGFLICAAEMLAPGVFLLWIGLAAMANGIVLFWLPLSLPWTVLSFGALALLCMWAGKYVYSTLAKSELKPFLNQRAAGLIGTQYVLEQPIIQGQGSIRVQDSIWQVRGPDAAAGQCVVVVSVEGGVMLRVAPV